MSDRQRWLRLDPLIGSLAPGEPNALLASLSLREIPSLYGLRGVAALVVVVYHLCIQWKLADFPGYYSVTLFFELSGLLITWLLLKEIDATGKVDRGQFYVRRSLRLFPVFYFVWILCRLAGPFAGSWAYLLYLGDYFTALTGKYSILTSAWSLGVEEKFYLIWPQVVVRMGLAGMTRVLAAILVLEPVYRWILSLNGHEYYTHFAFETNLDPIVLGCLIAVLVKRGWTPPAWMLHPVGVCAATLAGVVLWRHSEVVNLALAVILIYVICKPPRWLNHPIARYFGLISYSLYLCHEYAASVLWPWMMGARLQQWPVLSLLLQMLLGIAVASLLHVAVEKPFLRLKDRFHPRGDRRDVARSIQP